MGHPRRRLDAASRCRPRPFRLSCAALVLAVASAAAPALAASPGEVVHALSGAWELANPKASRSCRLNLGTEAAPGGHFVGAPPACRIAVPLLVQVSAWVVNEDRSVSLVDGAGKSVLDFHGTGQAGRFAAKAGTETYMLSPLVGPRDTDRTGSIAQALSAKAPAPSGRQVAAGTAPAATPAPASELPPLAAETVPGLYGMAREKNKPVCSLELATTPVKKGGVFVAKLSGGCIDPGLKVFDPVAWRIDKGHLVLVARKGHEQAFAPGPDGVFAKDPPSGSQLFLKKQ